MYWNGIHKMTRAFRERDLPTVIAFVRDDCGYDECNEDVAMRLCVLFTAWEKEHGKCQWDSTITGHVMWTRNRLMQQGAFGAGRAGAPEIHVGCEMHCFFIWIEETQRMLEALRTEDVALVSEVARSKMFSDPHVNQPIDRVAHRVAAPPK